MKLKEALEKVKDLQHYPASIHNIAEDLGLNSFDLKQETKKLESNDLDGHYERGELYGLSALFLDDELICLCNNCGDSGTTYYWLSEDMYKKTYDYVSSLVNNEIAVLTEEDLDIELTNCLI